SRQTTPQHFATVRRMLSSPETRRLSHPLRTGQAIWWRSGVWAGILTLARPGARRSLPMNYIDAHVHVWTPDTAHYPLAASFKKEDMKPPSFTPQDLFKHSKPAGVTRINLIQMIFYGFDNSYLLD